MAVLVDSSVWVYHFRRGNAVLAQLLELDLVLVHPLVVGELACSTPPQRGRVLADLAELRPSRQVSLREVLVFVERERLFGLGCGMMDLLLLGSVLLTPGARLWTRDARLAALSQRFGVMYVPPAARAAQGGVALAAQSQA